MVGPTARFQRHSGELRAHLREGVSQSWVTHRLPSRYPS
jgi:hypothetical protein